jgi:hypothetical protein
MILNRHGKAATLVACGNLGGCPTLNINKGRAALADDFRGNIRMRKGMLSRLFLA